MVSKMVPSENNRRARVYELTEAGRKKLQFETEAWGRFVRSVQLILQDV